jgi:translation initiation factor 1
MKHDKKSKRHSTDEGGYVYSTGGNNALAHLLQQFQTSNAEADASSAVLDVWLEKKGRGGKTAVVIKGFPGTSAELEDLAKLLKSKLGVGGAAKDGEIVIQGDQRDKVMDILKQHGHQVKRIGG